MSELPTVGGPDDPNDGSGGGGYGGYGGGGYGGGSGGAFDRGEAGEEDDSFAFLATQTPAAAVTPRSGIHSAALGGPTAQPYDGYGDGGGDGGDGGASAQLLPTQPHSAAYAEMMAEMQQQQAPEYGAMHGQRSNSGNPFDSGRFDDSYLNGSASGSWNRRNRYNESDERPLETVRADSSSRSTSVGGTVSLL